MLCPGHVAAITGIEPFLPVTTEYNIPAVICGFEAIDLIVSIGILYKQITKEIPLRFINTYKRCVSDAGNPAALRLINEVFQISDVSWRGIGMIQGSALTLNNGYEEYDAYKRFSLKIEATTASFPGGCECGKVLIGEKTPGTCVNFGCLCTPDHPIGPCMISSEGACAVYYRFGGDEI